MNRRVFLGIALTLPILPTDLPRPLSAAFWLDSIEYPKLDAIHINVSEVRRLEKLLYSTVYGDSLQ